MKYTLIILLGIFLLAAITIAQEKVEKPQVQVQKEQKTIITKPPIKVFKPDLTNSIGVFNTLNNTWVPNPGEIATGGGTCNHVKVYFYATLKGIINAENVKVKYKITVNNQTKQDSTCTIATLKPGETLTCAVVPVDLGGKTDHLEVTATVDPDNAINESIETNNSYSYKLTAQCAW